MRQRHDGVRCDTSRPAARPGCAPGPFRRRFYDCLLIAWCAGHGHRDGRPPAFDQQMCMRRNVVERCFNRLKQWRGIATRYEKTAESYQAAVTLASLLMWA
ncbi:transposase [Streptomyces sp. WAC 06783]|uniref:transposase n=1 Tax=Streptomyces sp. WAC 06783 TaxID=2203211 RepID=UPI0037DC044B